MGKTSPPLVPGTTEIKRISSLVSQKTSLLLTLSLSLLPLILLSVTAGCALRCRQSRPPLRQASAFVAASNTLLPAAPSHLSMPDRIGDDVLLPGDGMRKRAVKWPDGKPSHEGSNYLSDPFLVSMKHLHCQN